MVNVEEGKIKELVREHYGGLARGSKSQIGLAATAPEMGLYSKEEVAVLPTEAVQASAGCGNPTALASLNQGETVVDFGSGGGIDCFLAAQQVGPEGRVIGIDMTPDMIALANKNRDKLRLSNVEFHLAEMENTPLEDETTDVIISNCVITLAPDKDAVFREAFRILKPGGRMYISDMVLREELPSEVRSDMDQWVACVSGADLVETYLARLGSAGFAEVQVMKDTHSACYPEAVRDMDIVAVKPE
jgi:SAM-dependent methyltransferase